MASTSDYNWWIKERKLGIGKYNATSTDLAAHAGFALVRYRGTAYAKHFTEDLKEESQLPKHLHRALLAGFLRNYYEDKPMKTESDTINQRVWSGVYDKLVRKGREYASMGKYAGIREVQPRPFL